MYYFSTTIFFIFELFLILLNLKKQQYSYKTGKLYNNKILNKLNKQKDLHMFISFLGKHAKVFKFFCKKLHSSGVQIQLGNDH